MTAPIMPATMVAFDAASGRFVAAVGTEESFFDTRAEASAYVDDFECQWYQVFGHTYQPYRERRAS